MRERERKKVTENLYLCSKLREGGRERERDKGMCICVRKTESVMVILSARDRLYFEV